MPSQIDDSTNHYLFRRDKSKCSCSYSVFIHVIRLTAERHTGENQKTIFEIGKEAYTEFT